MISWIYILIALWNKCQTVDMSLNSKKSSWFWANQSLHLHLNDIYFVEKGEILIALSVPQSTPLVASTLAILEFAPEWSEEHVIFYLIYFVLSVFGSSEIILDVEVILEILPKR
jgi:hypothetical protein